MHMHYMYLLFWGREGCERERHIHYVSIRLYLIYSKEYTNNINKSSLLQSSFIIFLYNYYVFKYNLFCCINVKLRLMLSRICVSFIIAVGLCACLFNKTWGDGRCSNHSGLMLHMPLIYHWVICPIKILLWQITRLTYSQLMCVCKCVYVSMCCVIMFLCF